MIKLPEADWECYSESGCSYFGLAYFEDTVKKLVQQASDHAASTTAVIMNAKIGEQRRRIAELERLLHQAHELCEAISLGVISRNNAENLAGELDKAIKEVKP